MSSIITVSQTRATNEYQQATDDAKISPGDSACVDSGELEVVIEQEVTDNETEDSSDETPDVDKAKEREDSLAQLQGQLSSQYNSGGTCPNRPRKLSSTTAFGRSTNTHRTKRQSCDAVIVLKEEKVFQTHHSI